MSLVFKNSLKNFIKYYDSRSKLYLKDDSVINIWNFNWDISCLMRD
jgi:hypothetical protein